SFVIILFHSALMACANIRLSGGDPALGDGFRFAWENVERILLWSLIAATVGILLRMLEQSRVLRWVVGRVLELGWSLATFFIIPVIIFEDLDVLGSYRARFLRVSTSTPADKTTAHHPPGGEIRCAAESSGSASRGDEIPACAPNATKAREEPRGGAPPEKMHVFNADTHEAIL